MAEIFHCDNLERRIFVSVFLVVRDDVGREASSVAPLLVVIKISKRKLVEIRS